MGFADDGAALGPAETGAALGVALLGRPEESAGETGLSLGRPDGTARGIADGLTLLGTEVG